MDVEFTVTTSEYVDLLPIQNGQLIILKDKDAMYYDANDQRHPVGTGQASDFVTVNTDQKIPSNKVFTGTLHIKTLTQGDECTASQGCHSEGNQSSASGQYSHAEGISTNAQGKASHTLGNSTSAEGECSTAYGIATRSVGKGSSSFGGLTETARDYSFAIGVGNDPQSEDVFEVGGGDVFNSDGSLKDEAERIKKNVFRITSTGTVYASEDFISEGSGMKLSDAESTLNKQNSISSTSTHSQYPSAKAVYDLFLQSSGVRLTDDTTGTQYSLGVNNGVLYIKEVE